MLPLQFCCPVLCPAGPAAQDVALVNQLLEERGSSAIPSNFVKTAEAYDPSQVSCCVVKKSATSTNALCK
jgi:hypothetical protein